MRQTNIIDSVWLRSISSKSIGQLGANLYGKLHLLEWKKRSSAFPLWYGCRLTCGARAEGWGNIFNHYILEKRFKMGANDVKLMRVFTRETGAVIADVTFPSNAAFEAVIDCKVGAAIHDMGARYEIKIDVIDFSAMVTIVSSAIVAAGLMGDAGWPTLAQQFVFPIPEPGIANEGHIWKVFASLKVGVVNPYASLAESELFLITTP